MPIHCRAITAAILAATPLLALAWMPEPPPGFAPPGYGYPGPPPSYGYPELGPRGYPAAPPWAPGSRAPAPEAAQASPTPETAEQALPSAAASITTAPGGGPAARPPEGPGPGQVPPGAPHGYPDGPMPDTGFGERPRVMPGQLRILREVTDDAYLVHIQVGDGKTDEVQVTPQGRSLAISRSTDAQTLQEDSFDEGRGYRRSFSFSRGALSRRVGLPPDANPAAMTREVKDGTITLRIPRSARRGWEGYGPGVPPVQAPGTQRP